MFMFTETKDSPIPGTDDWLIRKRFNEAYKFKEFLLVHVPTDAAAAVFWRKRDALKIGKALFPKLENWAEADMHTLARRMEEAGIYDWLMTEMARLNK